MRGAPELPPPAERTRALDLGSRPSRRSCAIALAGSTLLATWLLSGVALSEIARFALYEVCYTLLPGCTLYTMLSPRPGGWLRVVAIGWPCGYAIEVAAFAATAVLHVRGAFALLPALALAGLALPLYRRRRAALRPVAEVASSPRAGAEALAVAAVVSVAWALLAFTFFSPSPLPRSAASVAYSGDNVFDISLAAEARNHWPITEPWVSGEPFHYYTAVFMHIAAINQVSGVSFSTVVLRLLPSTLLLIVALQLWSIGRAFGRSRWVGPLAAALLLVVEDINLDPLHNPIFHVSPFSQFYLSPTFALGATFFLALLALMQARLIDAEPHATPQAAAGAYAANATSRRAFAGALVLLWLLVMGAGASKTFAMATFVGGLGLLWLARALRGRPARALSYCLFPSLAGVAVVYFVMLAGGMASTLGLRPGDFLTSASTLVHVHDALRKVLGDTPLWVLPAALGGTLVAACLLTPLAGSLWLPRSREPLPPVAGLLCSTFVVGVLGYTLLGAPGGVEGDFLVYGYIAVLPLAALGLVGLWRATPVRARRPALAACARVGALAVILALIASALTLSGRAREAFYALIYGLVAVALAVAVVRSARLYAPAVRARPARLLAGAIPLLLSLGLVKPATLIAVNTWKTIAGRPIAVRDSPAEYGMTAALYRGLRWLHAHSSTCDVLAVNNHYFSAHSTVSIYFYYSAFSERRVFLESWYYSPNGARFAQPFPPRARLNAEAVQYGSPAALRRLREDGVRYVLIDKLHGGGAREPASISRLVFSDSALDIYRLSGPARTTPSC